MARELVEHTSEVELRLRAPTVDGLFAEAGLALAEMMLGEIVAGPETAHENVALTARDHEALLVAWINEIVFRSETEGVVFTRFEVTLPSETELAANIHGFSPPTFQSPVKAATYHRLRIAPDHGELVATVILDV
jgi:SHS2 domain-containing protein